MDKPLYFKTRVDAVSECFPGICCTKKFKQKKALELLYNVTHYLLGMAL